MWGKKCEKRQCLKYKPLLWSEQNLARVSNEHSQRAPQRAPRSLERSDYPLRREATILARSAFGALNGLRCHNVFWNSSEMRHSAAEPTAGNQMVRIIHTGSGPSFKKRIYFSSSPSGPGLLGDRRFGKDRRG